MAADDDSGDGTGLFDVCPASPLKNNDEGSLDIYAGLDSAVSDSTARSCVSFRNCLDLYEEILTEEGTAKEATYNDLQIEYGKCQRQMKDLMKRFKEIQTQNLNLKNENQSLKKNISALIKTARVEINRKDEEINHLHQRLSEFPHFRNNHKTARTKDSRAKSPHLDNCSKTDHGVKSDVQKDVHPNTSQPNLEKEGKSHSEAQNSLHLPTGIEKHCTNNVWSRSPYQIGEGNSNEDNRRGRNGIRHSQCSRGTERTQKDLNSSCSDGEPRDKEANSRLQGNPEKHGSSEPRAESKISEIKSSAGLGYKNERSASSWEKETSRERPHTQNDKNLERQNERLQNTHRKELPSQDKAERKSDVKFKPSGEEQGHRGRVDRALPPHSKNDTKYYGFNKYHPEDRRGREDCKRDRGMNSHGFPDRRCSSSLSSNRNSKYPHSKEVSVAHQWENTPFKAERHRTEDRRKRERENKESRHVKSDKKSPPDHLQRTHKDTKKSTADGKRQTEPKHGKGAVPNNEHSKGTDNKECATKVENGPNEAKGKDLKLSFMEKLNLTLSPAKKHPACQDNPHQITGVPKPSDTCDSQSLETTETVTCLSSVSEHNREETKSELPEPKEALSATSQLRISIPENKMKEENRLLFKSVENTVPCELLACGTEISFPAPGETDQARCLFQSMEVEETCGGARAAASVVMHALPEHASEDFSQELGTKSHDGVNSCDISEGVKTKVVLSPKAAAASESHLEPLVEEPSISLVNCSGDNKPKLEPSLEERPIAENKSCPLEPCLPKETFVPSPQKTELIDHKIETGESNSVYQDDDNSVLSIDFNNLRPIPEPISPLNSPVRPVSKVLSVESSCAIPLYDSSHKDEFPTSSTLSTFKSQSDLNKENEKPVLKFDKCSEAGSCKNLTLDELEEGEIRSDDEESVAQKLLEKSARPRASTEVQPGKSSPGSRKSTEHVHKDNGRTAVKLPRDRITWSKGSNDSRPSNTERKSKTMSISSLEKILPLIPAPSSVWEVMHMLRLLGKHVRKSYMKFKIKFSLTQFHRIIESAILSFTSLIKCLDLSKICKSVSTLQKSLCEVIESNLKQVKKNGIVDRLFEQQQTDMKKKLWKFVDEQLDYLFEKLKKILLKFCDSVNFENDNSEGKLGKKYKERTQHSNCQKKKMDNKEIRREKVLKSENTVNFKSSLGCENFEEKHQDQNKTNTSIVKHDAKRTFSTCTDNTKNSERKEEFLEMNCPRTPRPGRNEGNNEEETQVAQHTGTKSERSFEILTEQQASSLTFNLVSDAQMGEIFKSLLQGSDLLDTSGTEKAEWELKTPEKQLLESLKCESAPACTTEELVSEGGSLCPKVISDDNWSLLSSEKGPSLSSGLSLPVHPDVLDENCMFEVSSNIALGKDNVYSSEKSKPCISSILLEDLAVSLTVPSPLKSDGHLSFLKPEVLSTSTPEEVISAHFSEDALLEEEDASEQDIHLALESDNSSSKSSCSSWTSRSVASGFQYHPNLPMHAVIMEKSNDHFIVKIRRATPSTSPGLKHGMVAEESPTSLPRTGKEADMATEKEPILFQGTVLKPVKDLENSDKNTDKSKPTHEEQNSIVQTQVPDIYGFLKDASNKVVHCDQVVDDCFKLHQVWEPKVSENLQELPSMEKIPPSVDNHLSDTNIDLTKDPATETKSLGELMEVTVLNIDHLECSKTNLDQDAEITCSPLQPHTIDAFIDLTHDASSESKNEGSEPVLAVDGMGCQVICIDEDSHKEGKMERANSPLECIVEETCIDLTSESPGSCEIKSHILKSEPPSKLNCIELPETLGNGHKKRKNSPDVNHSSQKKQRKDIDLSSEKTQRLSPNSDRNGDAHRKQATKKREPAVNDTSLSSEANPEVKGSAAALATFPASLSAKNVIKKKGEIIVSWTRNDDREILLECQKRMPSLKTFTYLAVKLNKNPNQVSERFQQLKKLFEKSKCR